MIAGSKATRTLLASAKPDGDRIVVSFSSEEPVLRSYGWEVLDHSPGSIDFSRLKAAAPLLMDHDTTSQIGVVDHAELDATRRRGKALLRFSAAERAQTTKQDMLDGIRPSISVGYEVIDVRQEGVRDGEPVYRVTRWRPYEISSVSVPADFTVGVGRSLTKTVGAPTIERRSIAAQLAEIVGEKAAPAAMLGAKLHDPKKPATLTTLAWDDFAPSLRVGEVMPTGQHWRLKEAVLASARTLQLGAHLLPYRELDDAEAKARGLAIYPKLLRIVDPAPFATQAEPAHNPAITWSANLAADTADAAVASIPVKDAYVSLGYGSTIAVRKSFRCKISHATRRDDAGIFAALSHAIVHGIARAVDEVLLAAITAASPTVYTLAAAAAAGRRFGDLRALVGTAGNGAAVAQDGVLRAAGVPADLTASTAKTFVADWSRVGVAVHEQIDLVIDAVNKRGDVFVTVALDCHALLPEVSSSIWEVAP
jgi:phage head maturation protease